MSSVEEANGPAAPDKFTEASYAPVLPKKVAARKDVWFISAPADFDLHWIEDLKLRLPPAFGKAYRARVVQNEAGDRRFEVWVVDPTVAQDHVALLPTGQGNKLEPAAPFRRCLRIVEVPVEGQEELEAPTSYQFQQVPVKTGLRVRYLPAGANTESVKGAADAGPSPAKRRRRVGGQGQEQEPEGGGEAEAEAEGEAVKKRRKGDKDKDRKKKKKKKRKSEA